MFDLDGNLFFLEENLFMQSNASSRINWYTKLFAHSFRNFQTCNFLGEGIEVRTLVVLALNCVGHVEANEWSKERYLYHPAVPISSS